MNISVIKKRFLWSLYLVFYLPAFFFIEQTISLDSGNIHMLNSAFDDQIPFIAECIIPYYFWFIYVIFSAIHMIFKADNKQFNQFIYSLTIGMTIFIIFSLLYPNGINIRPNDLPDTFCGHLVARIYKTDTSTNVFPSIHVYNSLVVCIALYSEKHLKGKGLFQLFNILSCILICLSTLFTKQHCILDVIGGILMMCIFYFLLYVKYEKISGFISSKVLKKDLKEVETKNN